MNKWLIFAGLFFVACNSGKTTNTPEKGKLPTTLVNNPMSANGVDTVSAARKPTMEFTDTLHDFGKIHEGEKVTYEFGFSNKGKTPLIITSAYGSCGCTVPEFPKDPVQPGQSGIIKVIFNSQGKSGHIEKSVTVRTNTLRSVHMLYIKGEVEPKK